LAILGYNGLEEGGGQFSKFTMEKNTGDRMGWKSRIGDRRKMPTWATSTFSTALFRGITT
jgi:hypothetical protein